VLEMIDFIFNVLEDGKWHSLTEVADKSGLHGSKLEIATDFLAEYAFIELDKAERKVKLVASVFDFLNKIRHIEEDER